MTALVEDSDCLLMLGVLLSDTNFGVPAARSTCAKAVYAADRQVQIGFHHYPDLPLGALVEALLALVSDLDPPGAAPVGLICRRCPRRSSTRTDRAR